MNSLLNTCNISNSINTLAYYSHLIPIFFALSVSLLVFLKSKSNVLSKIFLAFSVSFALWLLGDLITWVSVNYYMIYASWSILAYIEIVFFTLGLYFILSFIKGKDLAFWIKLCLFAVAAFPLVITVLLKSVTGFDHSVCEAYNNTFLDQYKLYTEMAILIAMIASIVISFFRKQILYNKKTNIIVIGSMFLFLAVFGITEYIAAMTGFYELHLYSLFVIPLFLIAITYSIFRLDVFHLKIVSTYFFVFAFLILTASQLLFITDSTNRILTIVTLTLSAVFSFMLFKNLKSESDQRIHIEKLSVLLKESKDRIEETNVKLENANEKLKGLDKLKTEFLSLASHQLRSPLTAIKGYTSMLLDGDFGKVNAKQKEAIDRVFQSSNHLALTVEDLLNVAKIEQGGMVYTKVDFDLEKVVGDITKDLSVTAEKKGLKLTFETDKKSSYNINGDLEKIRQVVLNFIDNSMKYTPKGSITVKLSKDENAKKIIFAVSDTGMGIKPEIKDTLFNKFARGEGGKLNTSGSGLGLYLAKEIVEAHKGRVWAESEGADKGATFSVELNAI